MAKSSTYIQIEEEDGGRLGRPTKNILKHPKTTEIWTKTTPDLINDGYAWEKNGLPGAMYPRNYYRCTHRHDEGCRATKQVRKTDEDPPMYQTTYFRNHTCRNPPAPHLIQESVPLDANC